MGKTLQPGVDKIPESWVKDKVKAILDHYGDLHWDMPPASEFGTAGRHDFTICQNGLFWTIETKAGKNKPTELQINYAVDIAKAGGISLLINEFNLDEVKRVSAYINCMRRLPIHMGHDFTRYRRDASKKRRTRHVGVKPGVDHSSDTDR
ncbi:MAG TPA: hypothetical protein VN679_15155 [Candidatus Acidoferrales bacterium]|nr:hypothetical protein [Candidatus Acidoferrales bacterium]